MSIWLCYVIGVLVSVSVYLIQSRQMLRWLFGIVILNSTVNLVILVCGRLESLNPAFVPPGSLVPEQAVANPLPQALILTAIVISFGLMAFSLVLVRKIWRSFNTMNTDEIRLAEPKKTPSHLEKMY